MTVRPHLLCGRNPTREAWLAARVQLSVSASDVATLMGATPWRQVDDLMREKMRGEDRKDLDLMPHVFFGARLEAPTLAAWAEWERMHGVPTRTRHNRAVWASGERPWFGATPDGFMRRGGATWVVEVKRPRFFSMRKWDHPPEYYEWQVRAQMYVLGLRRGILVGHCDGAPVAHTIHWTADRETDMLRACDRFHERLTKERAT